MRWLKKKNAESEILGMIPGRRYIAALGQAMSFSIALFVALSAAAQFYVPGLLTDRVSPLTLVVLSLIGLSCGSLGDAGKGRSALRLLSTLVLVLTIVWTVWLFLDFFPEGRLGYTMLAVVALGLLVWRRPNSDNKK